jgi:hypothetical protein
MHKRIKDMMNTRIRVGGLAYKLRFKIKTRRKTTIVVVAQHICEKCLSSFFLSCSIINMVM